jgi:putative ABC transport system permease protein
VLVATELALAVLLLSGTGLMAKSFWRMNAHPPGFDPERVLTMKVELSGPQYRSGLQKRSYVDALLGSAQSLPGVQAASINTHGDSLAHLVVEGAPPLRPDQPQPPVFVNATSSAFTRVMGLRVVSGRWLTDAEPATAVVLNESLARRLFGGDDPIGRRIHGISAPPSVATVVGVVADLKYSKLDDGPEAEAYIPYSAASNLFGITLVVRTTGDPLAAAPAIQKMFSDMDKTQVPFDVMTLEQALAGSIIPRRFNFFLLGTFATAALLLALIGIYGVTAYSVAQRTHEMGIRMALGAQHSQVVYMVVWQGMKIALAGIVMGLAAAAGLMRLMGSLLYDVEPTDPQTYATVAGVLALTALAACLGPALKAALVEPMTALRYE